MCLICWSIEILAEKKMKLRANVMIIVATTMPVSVKI